MKNKKFYTQALKILPVFTVDLFPYPRQQCCGEVCASVPPSRHARCAVSCCPAACLRTVLGNVAQQQGDPQALARRLAREQGALPLRQFAPGAGVLGVEMRRGGVLCPWVPGHPLWQSPVKSHLPPPRPASRGLPGQAARLRRLLPPSGAAGPGRPPPRRASSAARKQRPLVEAGGGSDRAKKWLCLSYPLSLHATDNS